MPHPEHMRSDGVGRNHQSYRRSISFFAELHAALIPTQASGPPREIASVMLASELTALRVEFVGAIGSIGMAGQAAPQADELVVATEAVDRAAVLREAVGPCSVCVRLRARSAEPCTLVIHFPHDHQISGDELHFARVAGEWAWAAIELASMQAALRESEARLAATLDSVPVGVAMVDGGGKIVLANSEYRQFLPSGVIPSCDPDGQARWRAWGADGERLDVGEYPGARAMRGERTVPGQEMLYRTDAGQDVWTRVASVPIRDAGGAVVGQASAISDIDSLKRGSDALRESQARAQLLVDGIAEAVWEAAPDGTVDVDSPGWRAFTGQSYDQWRGYGWLDAIHPDDRASTLGKWQETVHLRQAVDAEYRLRGRDGQYRWMNVRAVPLLDEAGAIVKWLGMNINIDDRKRLEQTAQESQRRTRALMEGVPQLLWRGSRATEWAWASPQWTAYTGQPEPRSHGRGWLAVLHPDDRDATLAAWAGAEAGNSFEVEHRLRGRDGKYSWFSSRAVPVRREDGSVLEWIGTANDVDALHQAQARQAVLVAELQHRTRNLIAVVRALAEKTIDCTSSIAEFEACFTDRLAALARVQALLSHVTAGRKVTFAELVRSELLALGGAVRGALDDRIRLAGPADVTLRSGAVQTLALAIHELATNALKYGALAGSGGRLSIGWAVEHSVDQPVPELVVRWIETGVTPPTIDERHARRGYGRELIEDALPFQLKALTHYAFTPDGVACVIRLPIVAEPEEQME